MTQPRVLVLDVGTSSCRASLYDSGGRPLPRAHARVSYRPTTTLDGGAELDADELIAQVCATVDAVMARSEGASILGVAVTTFWHGIMGVDDRGQACTPLLPWLDARSRDHAAALKDELDEAAVHSATGCLLHWSYWPARLRWLARTRAHQVERAVRWVSFGEYLALRLFGRSTVSLSMASGTGLLNLHTRQWDEPLLAALSLDPSRLSPLVDSGDSLAGLVTSFASRWPALASVPWLPALGDGATSNVGAGCTTPERLALMVGTSGAIRAVWRTESVEVPAGGWCYRLDRERIVLGGALNDGGSLYDWLRRMLRFGSVADDAALAAIPPDAHGLTVLPYWGGERSPHWASDAQGAILGLRFHTSPVTIARACLEAVALQFGAIEPLLRIAMPTPGPREVVATGGALVRSPAWCQILADVLGQPLLVSAEPEASSRGAALIALERLGRLRQPLEALRPRVRRVHTPVAAHTERYRQAAARQRDAYQRLIDRPLQGEA